MLPDDSAMETEGGNHMNEKQKVSAMLRAIVKMETEDYIYFCIMLRASSPAGQREKTESIIQKTMNIRKKLCRKEIEVR